MKYMKAYHISPKKLRKFILSEGLKPVLGPRSSRFGENEPKLFFTKSIISSIELLKNKRFNTHPDFKKGIDYITWFLHLKRKNNDIIDKLGLNIDCVCCENITCNWAPSYGIADMIDDFNKNYIIYNTLNKFRIIYQKINGFDDLIYKNIILYLYNGNTKS